MKLLSLPRFIQIILLTIIIANSLGCGNENINEFVDCYFDSQQANCGVSFYANGKPANISNFHGVIVSCENCPSRFFEVDPERGAGMIQIEPIPVTCVLTACVDGDYYEVQSTSFTACFDCCDEGISQSLCQYLEVMLIKCGNQYVGFTTNENLPPTGGGEGQCSPTSSAEEVMCYTPPRDCGLP